ncbi:MAG: hypothetical protein A3I66_03320 [Burkholderiales bacterium RIFCSPLOWO2_02_FULL_57_36]|nr:MAG: hypothetical protein A3I66_03320 [Burkholderiales bacterium RIFCSPLOWO2_02_FULL_57_36]
MNADDLPVASRAIFGRCFFRYEIRTHFLASIVYQFLAIAKLMRRYPFFSHQYLVYLWFPGYGRIEKMTYRGLGGL